MNTRKKITRIICIAAAAAMIGCTFTACGGKDNAGNETSASDGTQKNAEEMVKIEYSSKDIKLPEGVDYVNSIQAIDGKIYFTYTDYQYDDATNTSTNTTYIYCMDGEGNVVSKTQLNASPIDENDNINLGNFRFMSDGTVWYLESHDNSAQYSYDNDTTVAYAETSIAGADAPAEEGEETAEETSADETEAPAEDTAAADQSGDVSWTSKWFYVHVDLDGNVLDSIDLNEITEIAESGYVNYIAADKDNNIYIGLNDSIMAVDPSGKKICNVSYDNSNSWFNGISISNDGRVLFTMYESSISDDGIYTSSNALKEVDINKKELVDITKLSANLSTVCDGTGDYIATYTDTSSIYGIKADGTSELIVDLLNAGVDSSYIYNVSIDGDSIYFPSNSADDGSNVITVVSKLDAADVKEKIKVDMAAYYLEDSVRSAVVKFNNDNPDYQICITDYSAMNDYSTGNEEDYTAGLTKLNAEITSGNIPDIISVGDMDTMGNYASKGLFIDLNEYIDGEDGLNRDDYFDNLWRASEKDGKLYNMISTYYVLGFAAKQQYIPEDGAVSFDTVDQILSAHEGMTMLSQAYLTRSDFISNALMFGYNSFVHSDNTCSFNTDEFVKILEMSNNYPEEFDSDEANNDPDYWTNYQMAYRNDKVLFNSFYLSSFDDYNNTENGQFGEKISLVGFPGTNQGPAVVSVGGSIGITKNAAHPDAGWALIKSILSEETQDKLQWNFPVRKSSFNKLAEKAMKPNTYKDENGNDVEYENKYWIGDMEVKVGNVTQEQVDKITNIVSTCTNVLSPNSSEDIMNIINEETANFYNGQNTAQQTADMIQSRVQLFLSEQS